MKNEAYACSKSLVLNVPHISHQGNLNEITGKCGGADQVTSLWHKLGEELEAISM